MALGSSRSRSNTNERSGAPVLSSGALIIYVRLCVWTRERERERRGGVHPHSLYPYLTVNPPVSLVLLLLLAHCVSRIPSLRALTHCTLLPFSRSAAPDALKKFNIQWGISGGRDLLGYTTVISVICPATTGRPPPVISARGRVLLCWTSHPPSVL